MEIETNKAYACGRIHGEFEYDHEAYGEKFYSATLEIKRNSGTYDSIMVRISDLLVDVDKSWDGKFVAVSGTIRTYDVREGDRKRHLVYLFVSEIFECAYDDTYENCIFVDGYVCKEPIYRETPSGRTISDVLIAVNRKYGKSDYIPCIFWGRNALYAKTLRLGDRVTVKGRLQSREYVKKISETEEETRTAHEVSANSLEVVSRVEQKED